MSDAEEVFEIERAVDLEQVAAARRDETAALILQNARTARRFDPVGKVRSHKFENVLLILGLVLSIGCLAMCLLVFVVSWGLTGEINGTSLSFGAVFLSLVLVFVFANHLRKFLIRRVDRSFVKKVAKRMKVVESRVPAAVRYRLAWPLCEGTWFRGEQVLASWTRDLSKVRYGLAGDASVVLFGSKKSIVEQAILFASFSDQEDIVRFLEQRGVEIERIGEHLLPGTTVERNLYPDG